MAFGVNNLQAHTEQKSILRSSKQNVLARLSRKELLGLAFQILVGGFSVAGHSRRYNICKIEQINKES